jgi:cell fate regulator YaaT (PSP1 superfamily)
MSANQRCYRVKILHSSATEVYAADDPLRRGDMVIVPTRYGPELGCVQGGMVPRGQEPHEAQSILRRATQEDRERFEAHRRREQEAFQTCRRKISERGLDMKLVSAHYLIDDSKILFYFTAENRVDFRELVKDLVGLFKIRIELRQIGVRDEARVVGGMGVCGRTFCCHGITDKLRAVSIKMAKEQNLTLNSMKISGPCGRLLCCLAYEYECYRDARREAPLVGARLRVGDRAVRVTEVSILNRWIRVEAEDGTAEHLAFDELSFNAERQEWRSCQRCPSEEISSELRPTP